MGSSAQSPPAAGRALRFFGGMLLAICGCAVAFAQESAAPPAKSPPAKSMTPGRTSAPPVIDGRMDESEWSAADCVEDFHQMQPVEYSPASQRTRVCVMYDSDSVYVAGVMYERDPSQITANVLRQGDGIPAEDRLIVTLDTFHDRRNGYFFMLNANGVRRQGLYQNTTGRNLEWKGIWQGRSSRDELGWVAEMRIPLKTMAFDPQSGTWGINFERHITRRNEVTAWSSRNRSANPGTSGEAHGFAGLTQGMGLDVVPSLSARSNRRFDTGREEFTFEPSLEMFYRPTPTLTAALTLNTDFSATEVDDRQVNLSRFNLFFPEKRAFFLEGADIFEFGRLDTSNDDESALPAASRQNGRPFFSRRIGLGAIGQPVDIIAGAKLTGRAGPWSIGLLDVQQDEYGTVDAQNLLVGRAALSVLAESSLGAIVTHGNPHSNLSNSLAGIDFRYRNSRLPGNNLLEAEGWYQRSRTQGIDDDEDAFAVRVRLPNTVGWRAGAGIKVLEENFNPALGFVNRRGIRDQTAEFGYRYNTNGSFIQGIYGGLDAQRIDLIDGGLDSELIVLRPLELYTRNADSLKLRSLLTTEVLPESFEIAPGVVIPAGRYEFDEYEITLEGSGHRRFSGSLVVAAGDFYDGERVRLEGAMSWRPSPHFALVGSYEFNDIDLPHGSFISRLTRLRLDAVFSTTLSWSNFAQYDNISETIGINSRLHWIPEAGREAFLVMNYGLEDPERDNRFTSLQSDLVMKVGYTLRF